MVTQTVREYPHQLGGQTLHYKTLPRILPVFLMLKPVALIGADAVLGVKVSEAVLKS